MTTQADGTVSTRWGKTAACLSSLSTRNGRQVDMERQKRRKGYTLQGAVVIDEQGNVSVPVPVPLQNPLVESLQPLKPKLNLAQALAEQDEHWF